jgi:hypothetical protein
VTHDDVLSLFHMKKHWVIFKNGIKFFIMADSFEATTDKYVFTRGVDAQPDVILKSEVGAILVDGTVDGTDAGAPLVG